MIKFSKAEEEQLIRAIQLAEEKTSGEIRVHISGTCKNDPFDEGLRIFRKLGMEKTKARNGVLVFLALDDRKMAIVADKGINDLVPEDFWISTKDIMIEQFKSSDFVKGLELGLMEIGKQLGKYFPLESDDTNELSNEISYD